MLALLLLACRDPADPVLVDSGDSSDSGPPTETFPQFRGSVPKNLLMFSMDTFRKDHVGRYGDHGVTAFLDAKMAQGLVLDQHRSCSNWTMASVWCVGTGASNVDLGYVPQLADGDAAIAPVTPTLASTLADAGYYTVLLTSNGWFNSGHGTSEGFQVAIRPDDARTLPLLELGAQYIREAQSLGYDRWYLHLHVKEPHAAYNPPDEYLEGLADLDPVPYDLTDVDSHYAARDGWWGLSEEEQALLLQHLLVRYAGEVEWLDDQLEEGWKQLDQAGILDDTLVVVWVDHGEQFWEHDEQTHAYDLFHEENDVLAFFWAKNIVPGVWDGPTWHPDLAPTVLDLFAIEAPETMTGVPVGTADPDRVLLPISAARNGVVQAAIRGNEKLHYRWSTGQKGYFDLAGDPIEANNRYDPASAAVIDLWGALLPEVERAQAILPEFTPVDPGP